MELLRPLVERWLAEKKVTALTGADQFIYYRQFDTRGRVAPDVFVIPGVRPGRRIKSWKTWIEGVVPTFALEVVTGNVDKDYVASARRRSASAPTASSSRRRSRSSERRSARRSAAASPVDRHPAVD